jgi:CheY-like chemotaxis protein
MGTRMNARSASANCGTWVSGAEENHPTETQEAAHASGGDSEGVTILVVEDEEMLREFVSEALGMLGYRTLTAANGREALEVWAKHRNEIDLLLTDVVMPESISGRQLAHTLIMERPDLKVIFTSGYSAELIGPEFEQEREHTFLAKPYLTDQLARTVAARLNQ